MKTLTGIVFFSVIMNAIAGARDGKKLEWGYSNVDLWVYDHVLAPVESGLACDLLIISNLCYFMEFKYKPKYSTMSEDIAKNFFKCYPKKNLHLWKKCQLKAFANELSSADKIDKAFCQEVPADNDALDTYDDCLMKEYSASLGLAALETDIDAALDCQGSSVMLVGPRFDTKTYGEE